MAGCRNFAAFSFRDFNVPMPNLGSMSDAQSPVVEYPGDTATPKQLRKLADKYFCAAKAAHAAAGNESKKARKLSLAPARFLQIHAIELLMNAWLLRAGVTSEAVRGMQHSFQKRIEEGKKRGLCLPEATIEHLARIDSAREYVVVRYDPSHNGWLSEPTRLEKSLQDIREAVDKAFAAPAP
jgi:hypothetical protein